MRIFLKLFRKIRLNYVVHLKCTPWNILLSNPIIPRRFARHYNIGSRNEWTNLDLVRVIIRVIRDMTGDTGVSEDLITFVPDRPGHDFRYAIDPGKTESELLWRAVIPFETGLRETVRWYLDKVQSPSPSF